MKHFKLTAFPLAVLALAVGAASAFATVNLPDISVTLAGGTYPIHLLGKTSAKTRVADAAGAVLEGAGATLLLLAKELSALGTFTSDFTSVEEPKTKDKCHTTGDAEGVMLSSGEYHLVPLEVSGALPLGILYLISEFETTCTGGIDVLFRGNMLSSLEGIGSESTELCGASTTLEGSETGKPDLSTYFNDGGTKITTKLETEAGAGFVQSDVDVTESISLSVLGSQMILITNR